MLKVHSKNSEISGLGKGLFALQDIEKDEVIVEYLGDLLSPGNEPKNPRSNLYFKDGTILCCFDDDLASYANDCVKVPSEPRKLLLSLRKYKPFYEKHSSANLNAEIHLDEENHKAFLYARQNIKKDEEIFCHYGFPYWFNYEIINIGFNVEKEIKNKGLPDNLFKYSAFHAYVKEFYPQSNSVEVSESSFGFVVAIKFENNKGLVLNMPRISELFQL